MTEEIKKPEAAPEKDAEKPNTISLDIEGISIPNVPVDIAKQIIEKRQAGKKEVSALKEAVVRAEQQAKAEADRAALLKAMKDSDIDSVKSQVANEYINKIAAYEKKIFNGEIKSLLASEGTLPGALDDAANLALQGAKVELKDGKVVVGDKPAEEYVKEFIKSRPHLLAVKATNMKKDTPSSPPKDSGFNKFAADLFTKPQK